MVYHFKTYSVLKKEILIIRIASSADLSNEFLARKVRLVRFSYFPTNFGQSLWLPIWIWCFIRICSTIGYLFCYMEKQQNIEFWAAHYSKFQACIIKKDLSRDLTPTHWVPWFWKKSLYVLVWPYIKTMILSKDIFKNKNIS